MRWILLLVGTYVCIGCAEVTPGMCVPLAAPEAAEPSFDRNTGCSSIFNVADTQRIRRACPEATLDGLTCPIPESMPTIARSDVLDCGEIIEATEGCASLRDVTARCFCPEAP